MASGDRTRPGSPPPAARPTGWKLALPNLSLERPRPDAPERDGGPLSPPSAASPMSAFVESLSMKKRLSDSITDRWSRRRPSLPQGHPNAPKPPSRSKEASQKTEGDLAAANARGRALSSAVSKSEHPNRPRSPPVLDSSASMTTVASTSSSSSSFKGGLSGHDSYADLVARGFPQPPVSSAKDSPVGDSPTVPVFEPVRSQRIYSEADLEEVDNEDEAEGGYRTELPDRELWEDLVGESEQASSMAAADIGMRRMTGLTRKISDSKRIIPPPTPDELEEDDPFEDPERASEEDSTDYREEHMSGDKQKGRLGVPTAPASASNRHSAASAGPSPSQAYDMSSDEESTSSSLRSVGTKSIDSKAGLPHIASYSQNRTSRTGSQPPPLDLSMPGSSSSLDKSASPRPQSATTTTASLKSGPASASSVRSRSMAVLEVPTPTSASRVSSLSAQNTVNQAVPAVSGTTPAIARSDSNSSVASVNAASQAGKSSAAVHATVPAAGNRHNKYTSPRDKKLPPKKAPVAVQVAAYRNRGKHPPSLEPPIPDPTAAPKVSAAPASGMYWYRAPTHGMDHKPLRAHTCTLVGSNIYVFGGCDAKTCFNELHVFDADSMSWNKPPVHGEVPPPLRAMTTTAVRSKLVIFGGGDGPTYYNDIYVFDTITNKYTKPQIVGGQQPCRRRAHTACLYKNGIYVFGGGDGVRALNDVWRLDVSDLSKPFWKLISPPTSAPMSSRGGASTIVDVARPTARGYHTANMVGSKLIIFGGSDGDDCFKDVWVFDVETHVWKCVDIKKSFSRLSHTATIIGSYLFVVGGHDGVEYSSEVLLLNLVTMQWDRRKVYGMPPSGRGYHGAVLYDSRLFIIGGFDGHSVFNDTYILELAVSSYYSQISHFSIVVSPG